MADKCSIKFWLPRDLYGSILALAYRRRTSMSSVLRTLCKAVQEVNREYYIQEELDKINNPPRELSWKELKKESEEFKKSRPGLNDLFKLAKFNLEQELKPLQEEKKMQGKKSIKFWLDNDVYEFIKMAALLRKRSMSDLFREYAHTLAEDAKKLARERFKDMDQNMPGPSIVTASASENIHKAVQEDNKTGFDLYKVAETNKDNPDFWPDCTPASGFIRF